MDSDGPLKVLFQKYAQDLLPLTGDAGAQVERAGPVEIHAMKRQADCVLSLERNGERYYRHVEFQTAPDPEMRGGSELQIDVLLALASRFYTVDKLARIVRRDRMWEQSSLYVEGKAEGRLEHARETCVAHARKHHPAVFHRVEAIIAACDDSARLQEWALAASDLNDDGFVELVSTARP